MLRKVFYNGPKGQLYNIKDDPLESDNLFLEYPLVAKELKNKLGEQVHEDGGEK